MGLLKYRNFGVEIHHSFAFVIDFQNCVLTSSPHHPYIEIIITS